MAAIATAKPSSDSYTVNAQIKDLDRVYLIFPLVSGKVAPRLTLVFLDQKTAEIASKVLKNALYPSLYVPDLSEEEESRCWTHEFSDFELSAATGMLDAAQSILKTLRHSIPANGSKTFEVTIVLPDLYV